MELSIARGSWILRVAQYGGLDADDRSDLCSVWWAFWWGVLRGPFFVTIFGVLGASVVFALVVDPILSAMVWMNTGVWLSPEVSVIQACVWVVIAFVGYTLWCEKDGRENKVLGAVDVIRAGYRGWKDKTCVMVAIK